MLLYCFIFIYGSKTGGFFLFFERVFGGDIGTIWFPVISPDLKSGSGGFVLELLPGGARFFFSFFSGPPATTTSLGT